MKILCIFLYLEFKLIVKSVKTIINSLLLLLYGIFIQQIFIGSNMSARLIIEDIENIQMKPKTALEELMERGIMDERDVDYLEHLEIPQAEVDEVALEGVIGALLKDEVESKVRVAQFYKAAFINLESKKKYFNEMTDDLITWLKEKDSDYPGLKLDMGAFKTWLKTAHYQARYYPILVDDRFNRIIEQLKDGKKSKLENWFDFDLKGKLKGNDVLDNVKDIKELIKTVELYKSRFEKISKLLQPDNVKQNKATVGVVLAGLIDLRITVKKIVNLAI